VSGFNAGAYIPSHPHEVRPAAEAALKAVAAGLGQTEIEVLPFSPRPSPPTSGWKAATSTAASSSPRING
jgi:hypothetical protein